MTLLGMIDRGVVALDLAIERRTMADGSFIVVLWSQDSSPLIQVGAGRWGLSLAWR